MPVANPWVRDLYLLHKGNTPQDDVTQQPEAGFRPLWSYYIPSIEANQMVYGRKVEACPYLAGEVVVNLKVKLSW